VADRPDFKAYAEYLRGKGLQPHVIQAMLDHMNRESGGRPTLSHDKGTGFGLYGFRDPTPGQGRWTNLKNFAGDRDPNDWRTQLDFTLHEMGFGQKPEGSTTWGSEKAAGDRILGAKDYGQASEGMYAYLRPLNWNNAQRPATPTLTERPNTVGSDVASWLDRLTGGSGVSSTGGSGVSSTDANAQQNKPFDWGGLLSSGMETMAKASPASMGGGGGDGGPPPMPNLPAHRPQMQQFVNPLMAQQQSGMGMGLLSPGMGGQMGQPGQPGQDQIKKLLGLLSGGA